MLFNSYEFLFFFLPASFFIYFFLLEKRLIIGAKSFLVFSSLVFYSWWNIYYLPIILSSILFNYVLGNSLNDKFKKIRIHKKALLFIGIGCNLALLGYFKYTDFFIENFNLAVGGSIPLLHLALPLAISFFTFQQIAYLVDSYRGETEEYDLLNYSLFVTFFPQLIAGPIVHHAEIMPQFYSAKNLVKNYRNIALGLFIFAIGLFKKVVIADSFSQWVSIGFNSSATLNFFDAWATSLSYTFQLYFDFSGYTDMAIGIALLFNIKLPVNFNSPYKSLDIQDFWRRWHITLSRFLRDYIYIPLGGSRKGAFRTYNNVLATFVIGGIWHGAGWTFILWGALHGIALVVHRFWKHCGLSMPRFCAWFITFNFVNIAWVFFRAEEWASAINVLSAMGDIKSAYLSPDFAVFINYLSVFSFYKFEGAAGDTLFSIETLKYLIIFGGIVFLSPNSLALAKYKFKFNFLWALLVAVLIFSSLFSAYFGNTSVSEFLYFNF